MCSSNIKPAPREDSTSVTWVYEVPGARLTKANVYVHVCVCMCTYVCVYMYICIYICITIHMYTHIYI